MAALEGVVSVRVVMQAGSVDSPIEWFNNHEIQVGEVPLGAVEIDAVCSAFVGFHSSLLLTPYIITRVILSSYAEDGKPYDPETLAIRLFNTHGSAFGVDGATQGLPLSNILRVQRDVERGRPGAMLLRGFLTETMIASDALTGVVRLTSLNDVQEIVSDAFSVLETALTNAGCSLVMAYGENTPTNVREVLGMTVRGVGSKQLRNKVAPRYGSGVYGTIQRALETIKDNAAALEVVKDLLGTLSWLGPLLGVTAEAARKRD